MGFLESISTCLKKTFTFKGRASRSEYWWFLLFIFLFHVIFTIFIGNFHVPDIIGVIYALAFLVFIIAHISASVRRLHDIDKSGWWYWICFVPFIGLIVFYWATKPSDPHQNQYD